MNSARGMARLRTWLIVSQLLGVASIIPWLAIAGLSFMAIDSPSAEREVVPRAVAGAIWLYPVVLIGCSTLSWLWYHRGRSRLAAIATSIPLVYAIPFLGYLAYLALGSV